MKSSAQQLQAAAAAALLSGDAGGGGVDGGEGQRRVAMALTAPGGGDVDPYAPLSSSSKWAMGGEGGGDGGGSSYASALSRDGFLSPTAAATGGGGASHRRLRLAKTSAAPSASSRVPVGLLARMRGVATAVRATQRCAVLALEAVLALCTSRVAITPPPPSSSSFAASSGGELTVAEGGDGGDGAFLPLAGPAPAPLLILHAGLLRQLLAPAWASTAVGELTALLQDGPTAPAHALRSVLAAAAAATGGGGDLHGLDEPPGSLDAAAGDIIAASAWAAASALPAVGGGGGGGGLPYVAALATALAPRLTPLLACLVALMDARPADSALAGALWGWCSGVVAPLLEVVVAGVSAVPTTAAAASSSPSASSSSNSGIGGGFAETGAGGGGADAPTTSLAALRLATAVTTLLGRLAACGAMADYHAGSSGGGMLSSASPYGGGGDRGGGAAWEATRADALVLRLFARFTPTALPPVPQPRGLPHWQRAAAVGSGGEAAADHTPSSLEPSWLGGVVPVGPAEAVEAATPYEYGTTGGSGGSGGNGSNAAGGGWMAQQQSQPSAPSPSSSMFRASSRHAAQALATSISGYLRSRCAPLVSLRAPLEMGTASSSFGGGGRRGQAAGSSAALLFRAPDTGVVTAGSRFGGFDGPLAGMRALPSISLLLGAVDAAAGLLVEWAALLAQAQQQGGSEEGGRGGEGEGEAAYLSSLLLAFENLVGAWLAHAVADDSLRLHAEDVGAFCARRHVAAACGFSPFATAALRRLQDLGADE